MKKIDNLIHLKDLLKFEKPGDFYMLYILKRKKDQPEGERDNHQSVRTIKSYCVDSIEYLEKRYDEIKNLCEIFKARAYIHVSSQNHSDVGLEMLSELANRIKNRVTNHKNLFDSVVGKLKVNETFWIVDIDTHIVGYWELIINYINNICRPEKGKKIQGIIPTRNGCHLITKKFDVMEFKKKFPEIDIQKKNPTLLYYPESLG